MQQFWNEPNPMKCLLYWNVWTMFSYRTYLTWPAPLSEFLIGDVRTIASNVSSSYVFQAIQQILYIFPAANSSAHVLGENMKSMRDQSYTL